ncbi:MAG: hypothetical protein SGPRY_005465 [Prymnesium sp.]
MSRLLRVKADLRQIVMSSEYITHKCSSDGCAEDKLEAGEEFDDSIGSKDGLKIVIERMCLRDASIQIQAPDTEAAMKTLTMRSPEIVSRVAQAEREPSVVADTNYEHGASAAWWSLQAPPLAISHCHRFARFSCYSLVSQELF